MIKRFFRDETGLELSEYAVAAALRALTKIARARIGAVTAIPASDITSLVFNPFM